MKKTAVFTLTLLVLSTIGLQTTFAQDTLEGHTDWVSSVAFSPDGTTLASGSDDKTVKLWDVATRENIATLEGHRYHVTSVSFSPDGTTLASAADYDVFFGDGEVKLWDVATRENIATLEGYATSVSFSSDGTTLASGSDDVKLWDVATRENIATLEGYATSVSFSPDGTLLASGSSGGKVKLWDVATRENIATLEGHTSYVRFVSFSPDGTTLASCGRGLRFDEVKLWDVATRENIATLSEDWDDIRSVAFSPDSKLIASGGDKLFGKGAVKLWDVTTHEYIIAFEVNDITSVAFSPDGTLLASGSTKGKVKLWNIAELTSTLGIVSGNNQEGIIDTVLANPLVVEVRDRDNSPVPGVEGTFTVISGHGQLSGKSTVDVTTDANGRAAQTLTLGTKPGINSVEVSIGNELVTFNAVGISPYKLEIISDNFQQGKFNTALEEPLVVEVRDRDNNPLPGVEVTFTVTYGDGMLSGQFTVEHITTDANGRAERTFTLGPNLGNIIEVTITEHESVTFYAVGNSPSYITAFEGHGDSVRAVAFSPDGTILASGGSEGWNEDGTVKLWDVVTRTNIATLQGHTDGVSSVAFSPDGKILASGSSDGTVKLWDVATKQNIATFKHAVGEVASVAFSPDGKTLASASLYFSFFSSADDAGTVELWDVATHENIATLQVIASSVSFSPDGTLLASGTLDGTVELWDVATKQNIATLQGHTYWVWSVAFSPDGKTLASGALDEDATTKLWNVATRENIATLQAPGVSVAFSPDGTQFASASDVVELWDAVTGVNIATLHGHTDLVYSVAFSPDGTTLASGSEDDTVKLWDVSEWMGPRPTDVRGPSATKMNVTDGGKDADPDALNRDGIIIEFDENIASSSLKLTYEDGTDLGWVPTVKDNKVTLSPIAGKKLYYETSYRVRGTVRDGVGNETDVQLTFVTLPFPITDTYSVSFSPDGKTLASGSDDGTVKLWDVATRENIATLEGHWGEVTSVSFSPDGTTLASGSDDGTVKLWDVATRENIATLDRHRGSVSSVSFSPDGTTLASGSDDGTVKLWDVATRENIATLRGHTADVSSVSFSPDGTTLASGSDDATVKLWDVATRENIATLEGHAAPVSSVSFSPDGTTLASGASDETVKLWDVATDTNIATLEGHTWTVTSVSFSPDGTLIASGSWDKTVKLWDVATHTNIATLEHPHGVVFVSFSPDGMLIASVGRIFDETVKLWDMSPYITPITPPESLTGDVNQDGVVNIFDLVLVAGHFGQTGQNATDVNGDGVVNIFDLVLVAGAFGNTAAAPSLRPQALAMLTVTDVQGWLTQARELNLTDAASQRGIIFLEQLLSVLTPKETELLLNYPNPFNPETWIPYRLAHDADVEITIYNTRGMVVRRLDLGHQSAGFYTARAKAGYWNGRNKFGELVASGVYFYQLRAGDYSALRRMVILK